MNNITIENIMESIQQMPYVEGPIPVSEKSYPFCDMLHSRKPLDVNEYGYCEEEYFVSGTSNIYDVDANDNLVILHPKLSYKTRVLVRKPKNISAFSGRVYFDILNATQNYDIEDLWHRSYLWCMENGHGYVGITSKPVNAQSLKNFDFKRYEDLDWTGPFTVPQPAPLVKGTIPGTEDGLFWDMLGQTATYIRHIESKIFNGAKVDYLCLTGQSQSGMYLNTYIANFDMCLKNANGGHLFDGYLNIAGVPLQRELRQEKTDSWLGIRPRSQFVSSIPFIMISSEGDIRLFADYGANNLPVNSDTDANRCRYYEVAGSPHTDIDCPVLCADSEIIKAGRTPQPMNDTILKSLNTFPLAYYVNGFLEKLYLWKTTGVAPEIVSPIERNAHNELVRDQHENVVSGFRSPYVDIPVASYNGCDENNFEMISGVIKPFGNDKLKKLYDSKSQYITLFTDYVNKQVEQGWLCLSDAQRMTQAAANDAKSFD